MGYDIDDFTELGERRLQILFENGQFDRFVEVTDVQRVGRHVANKCLSSSDVSTPRATSRSTGENMRIRWDSALSNIMTELAEIFTTHRNLFLSS